MASNCFRLRRVFSLSTTLLKNSLTRQPKTLSPLAALFSANKFTPPRHFNSTSARYFSSERRVFNPDTDEIGPDTILFEGCDYNHWLITVDFPKDQNVSRDQMVDTYVNIAAQVFGSVEEAKKKIYACSTTTYQGFQVECSEETSKKFEGLPGVVFILPDSYIDPVNKEYGGDKYVNGEIFPRPPPVHYQRTRERPQQQNYRPRSQNYGPPQQQPNYGPPRTQQGFGPPQQQQNYGPPQPPQQNFPLSPPQSNYGPPPPQSNYGPPPPHQNHGPVPSQPSYVSPPPQLNYGPPPSQHNYGPPQNNYGPPPPQPNYGPSSPQPNYGPSSPQPNYGPSSPQPTYGPSSPQPNYGPSSPQQNHMPPPQKQNHGPSPQSSYISPSPQQHYSPPPPPQNSQGQRDFQHDEFQPNVPSERRGYQ